MPRVWITLSTNFLLKSSSNCIRSVSFFKVYIGCFIQTESFFTNVCTSFFKISTRNMNSKKIKQNWIMFLRWNFLKSNRGIYFKYFCHSNLHNMFLLTFNIHMKRKHNNSIFCTNVQCFLNISSKPKQEKKLFNEDHGRVDNDAPQANSGE